MGPASPPLLRRVCFAAVEAAVPLKVAKLGAPFAWPVSTVSAATAAYEAPGARRLHYPRLLRFLCKAGVKEP